MNPSLQQDTATLIVLAIASFPGRKATIKQMVNHHLLKHIDSVNLTLTLLKMETVTREITVVYQLVFDGVTDETEYKEPSDFPSDKSKQATDFHTLVKLN